MSRECTQIFALYWEAFWSLLYRLERRMKTQNTSRPRNKEMLRSVQGVGKTRKEFEKPMEAVSICDLNIDTIPATFSRSLFWGATLLRCSCSAQTPCQGLESAMSSPEVTGAKPGSSTNCEVHEFQAKVELVKWRGCTCASGYDCFAIRQQSLSRKMYVFRLQMRRSTSRLRKGASRPNWKSTLRLSIVMAWLNLYFGHGTFNFVEV